MLRSLLLAGPVALAIAACDSASGGALPAASQAALAPAIAPAASSDGPDSMASQLRRFQAATRGRVDTLAHAARSREELASRFLEALHRQDTVALERMRVTPSEFAYLYFPESMFMRPPYELDPRVVWMQIDAASNTGLRRAVREVGGRPAAFLGLICQPPLRQGVVQLHGCDVRRRGASGQPVAERLFGAIIERDGRFKFLSLENRL